VPIGRGGQDWIIGLFFMKRSEIKRVLLCKPLFFSSLNYSINPWMKPGTIDGEKAMKQWESLVNIYKKLNITVEVIDQERGVPDMVFATDQAIVRDSSALISNFWEKERRAESSYYETWFREHGYAITHLPDNVYFEGNGDSYFWNDTLFIGVGYRANKKTCEALEKLLHCEVLPLHIVDPAFYHLDVGFFPLDDQTAFYYPEAFSQKSQDLLKKKIPNLIPFTKEEALGFCANSVVTEKNVIHQSGNPTFVDKLKTLGYKSIEVDVSEFKKSGGGIHCLTNILEYK
jgi:N-dimethylarginine dimethylaminohydrolase